MKQFPPSLINHIGGVVSARSVKLLDQINNPDEPETRDAWWTELRKEIRSHTRALACNAVLGYTESTYIADEICILSASGTAVTLKTCETSEQNLAGVMHQVRLIIIDRELGVLKLFCIAGCERKCEYSARESANRL